MSSCALRKVAKKTSSNIKILKVLILRNNETNFCPTNEIISSQKCEKMFTDRDIVPGVCMYFSRFWDIFVAERNF